MALKLTFNNKEFSIGDQVSIAQSVKEGEKERLQKFTGTIIAIKGRNENKSLTVRKVGANKIGIERIFPLESPIIKDIELVRSGGRGVRHAKLYFIRKKSRKQIEKVYQRASKKKSANNNIKAVGKPKNKKNNTPKKKK